MIQTLLLSNANNHDWRRSTPFCKHHRVPAPGIRFDQPNLPALVEGIERDFPL